MGYSWSFDVSTTNVGIALWNEKGILVELKHLILNIDKNIASEDRDIYKAILFSDYVLNSKLRIEKEYNIKIKNCFIEAPLQNTPKNINTTALLLGFNGMARLILYQILGYAPIKITVHESRKIFLPEFVKKKKVKGEETTVLSFPKGWKSKEKKEHIRAKVEKLEPNVKWFYTKRNTIKDASYDMSDAYCVGFCGLKALEIL